MRVDNTLKFQFRNIVENYFNLLTLLTFIFITTIGIVNHEMWRDELEAWLIARDSASISELLENIKYTGHPALWYLCLYFLAKITPDPSIMQLFHLVVATGVIYIFLYYSTFNRLQKTLFCFGYFPLYEYGTISRSYSLGILFVFLSCALFCQKNRNYIAIVAVLALLSHTSVYGSIIGISLAVMLVYEAKAEVNRRHILIVEGGKYMTLKLRNIAKNFTISIAIYLFGLLSAIAQIIPPSDAERKGMIYSAIVKSNNSEFFNFLEKSKSVFTGIWRSYVPIPNLSTKSWGSNIIPDDSEFLNIKLQYIADIDIASIIIVSLSLLLFLIFTIIFFRSRKVLILYAFGTSLITLFGLVIKLPAIRHNGHLFILLIACFWIYIYDTKYSHYIFSKHYLLNLIYSYRNMLLTIILSLHLYAGALMYNMDLNRAFSNSKSVAQFIKENNLEELTIIGSSYGLISPISAWLNKKIYYPEIQDFGTFAVWTSNSKPRNNITQRDILDRVEELTEDTHDSFLLILDHELNSISTSLDIQLLASYKNSLVKEDYFIYSVD